MGNRVLIFLFFWKFNTDRLSSIFDLFRGNDLRFSLRLWETLNVEESRSREIEILEKLTFHPVAFCRVGPLEEIFKRPLSRSYFEDT